MPNEENWYRCGMLSVESRYSAECNAESKKEKVEGAKAETTARVWAHKICLSRKRDKRKRNNQRSNRNGRRKVANRNSVVVLQISSVFSFSYLHLAALFEVTDSSFFSWAGSPNGIAKNWNLPGTVKNNAAASFFPPRPSSFLTRTQNRREFS